MKEKSKIRNVIVLISIIFLAFLFSFTSQEEWGFFAHKQINRLAVFTCPPELISFYKKHIEYISDHAIDPDMRRHASKFEGIRHYIDADHWGKAPFEMIPRNYSDAILKYAHLYIKYKDGYADTIDMRSTGENSFYSGDEFKSYYQEVLYPLRYEEPWQSSLSHPLLEERNIESIKIVDKFSEFGILPYAMEEIHNRLVYAFEQHDHESIIKLTADYGHYIADAHVPLHTTENYNGQLTGQEGIHAFWESRLPELFAIDNYDFIVGKAEYIHDIRSFFWGIVIESHNLVDEVLSIDMDLKNSFPTDLQYCYDERNGITIRTQCREYSEAYHNALNGMVENRFRDAIHATGSLWYTAWVQAGKPNLKFNEKEFEKIRFDTIKIEGKPIGRKHEGI